MTRAITAPSPRTRARRVHERAAYDRESLHAVLDAGLMCHVGFVFDGYPVVVPTLYWREGNDIYWHGSSASRMIRACEGADVCLTVSHMDGLVLARSAFHHSVNYRSAMIFGKARRVDDPEAKIASLKALIDGLYPGRWDAMRPINSQELKATRVLWMPLDEASVKVRAAPPKDDEADMAADLWAGVAPLPVVAAPLIPDETTAGAGREVPEISARLIG